jgi:hypothetical protein
MNATKATLQSHFWYKCRMNSSWFDYRSSALGDSVVVDLSELTDKLMGFDDIATDLTQEQEKRLVEYVKVISEMSHKSISKRYGAWQEADRAHDLYVPAEATAFRNKVVIADTRAISDTVLTYFMAAITGRNPMFQLEGLNRQSRKPAVLLERVLHQQMRSGAGEARLAQQFLDLIRYGTAPTKYVWNDRINSNAIVNCDPRKTFPDPRAQAGAVDKMQFIVFSDHASASALRRTGLYKKLDQYPRMLDNMSMVTGWESHGWHKELGNGWNINPNDQFDGTSNHQFKVGRSHVIDEAWICFNGYDLGFPQLGEVWMVVTVLDERFIIRAQLSPYGRQFPCVNPGFGFDAHKTHQQSLYDVLLPLHDLGTWLLRSRVDNVQAALNNLIFADPTKVAIHDLINRNPWGLVRTLPGTKPGDGVFIAQVPDVTKGHLQDINFLSDMKQRVAAASDAQQGMPTGDVRTATEIQRLTQLGSQRLGVLSRIISATGIRPGVRMMASNIQDAISHTGSIRVPEDQQNDMLKGMVDNGYVDYDVSMLQGEIEYMVVDGTLPLEPTRSPETWMQILQTVNQSGLQMEYDTGAMIEEAIKSMGVPDVDQFRISRETLQKEGMSPSQQLALMEKMRGASTVMPQENIDRQLQAGNIVPFRQAGGMQ